MTMIDVWVEVDGNSAALALHEAGKKLDSAGGDAFLDFSAVRRIDSSGLHYFRSRLPLATRDVEHGLKVTLGYFLTRQAQMRALDILQFKLDLLWSMLDAIQLRCGLHHG